MKAGIFLMLYNGDAKRIKAKIAKPEGENTDLFTDEPVKTPWEKEAEKEEQEQKRFEQEVDYTPAEETDMDFMTEEEEKAKKRNILIGALIGLLLAALLIGGFIYHNRSGKVQNANVATTASLSSTGAPGSLEPSSVTTTRSYVTRQLTVHKDKNGVWRSYAGLDPTVGYTGVVGNDTGWWYVENDVVNFKFNGIGKNDYGEWLVENGKVNMDYSGEYVYNGLRYTIQKGKVIKTDQLTTKATTHVTSTTSTTAATTTTAPTTTTTTHEHNWVTIYDGDAIVETGIRNGSACICLDCGLIFANAELLEAHAYANGHTITRDKDFGGLDSKHILSKQEVGDKDVIVGYTNPDNTYWKCTICGVETRDAAEADVDLR
ncbi:MAG: hypothetical protein IJ547_05875 [Clostridia bacterium]|nr:hypothetical protein [Clostridia bacterium]